MKSEEEGVVLATFGSKGPLGIWIEMSRKEKAERDTINKIK